MAKNTQIMPFTEIVERVASIGRERADKKNDIRGLVNDAYVKEIPIKEDWSYMVVSSAITLTERYNTGSVSANTGATTLTFSGATLTSSMSGRKIKIDGNDYWYDFTFVSSSSGTINPPLSGTVNVSGASFNITQPIYALAADFDRFLKDQGITKLPGGKRDQIREKGNQEFNEDFEFTPQLFPKMCRLVAPNTAGIQQVEVNAPPLSAISLPYDYIKSYLPMRETTGGLVSITSAGTTVTGDTSTQFQSATTGDYIRIDAFGVGADSEWYRIQTITGNSSLTIATAFGTSSVTSARFTISSSPDMPFRMQPGIMYSALMSLTTDQDDPASLVYKQKLAEVLSDGKKVFKTRVYSQEINTIATEYMYRR